MAYSSKERTSTLSAIYHSALSLLPLSELICAECMLAELFPHSSSGCAVTLSALLRLVRCFKDASPNRHHTQKVYSFGESESIMCMSCCELDKCSFDAKGRRMSGLGSPCMCKPHVKPQVNALLLTTTQHVEKSAC